MQVFWGSRSKTLSLVLIESEQRIFAVDLHRGQWHLHPFGAADEHISLPAEMSDNPIERFIEMVETILVQNDLL